MLHDNAAQNQLRRAIGTSCTPAQILQAWQSNANFITCQYINWAQTCAKLQLATHNQARNYVRYTACMALEATAHMLHAAQAHSAKHGEPLAHHAPLL
jgi:hypothetical protein